MAYQTIMDYNITGADDILAYANTIFPFAPILLFIVWLAVTMITYLFIHPQRVRDFGACTTVAGVFTMILATLLTFGAGIMSTNWWLITLAFTVILAVIYFLAGYFGED